jgi:hypothetical protein
VKTNRGGKTLPEMPPRKRKVYRGKSNVETLQRRLKKSVLYARLGTITGSGNVPGRVAAFKGWRKSPYDLLTQVYTGARMSDICQHQSCR